MTTTILHFLLKYLDITIIIVLYIIVEIIFSQIKRFRKNKSILPYIDAPNPETSDFYLLFFQKIQYLHVARVLVLLILI